MKFYVILIQKVPTKGPKYVFKFTKDTYSLEGGHEPLPDPPRSTDACNEDCLDDRTKLDKPSRSYSIYDWTILHAHSNALSIRMH